MDQPTCSSAFDDVNQSTVHLNGSIPSLTVHEASTSNEMRKRSNSNSVLKRLRRFMRSKSHQPIGNEQHKSSMGTRSWHKPPSNDASTQTKLTSNNRVSTATTTPQKYRYLRSRSSDTSTGTNQSSMLDIDAGHTRKVSPALSSTQSYHETLAVVQRDTTDKHDNDEDNNDKQQTSTKATLPEQGLSFASVVGERRSRSKEDNARARLRKSRSVQIDSIRKGTAVLGVNPSLSKGDMAELIHKTSVQHQQAVDLRDVMWYEMKSCTTRLGAITRTQAVALQRTWQTMKRNRQALISTIVRVIHNFAGVNQHVERAFKLDESHLAPSQPGSANANRPRSGSSSLDEQAHRAASLNGITSHARFLVAFLDDVIGNIDRSSIFTTALERFGRKHSWLADSYGVKQQHFDDFGVLLAETWVRECPAMKQVRESATAWRQLIASICEHMQHGFEQQRRAKRKAALEATRAYHQSLLCPDVQGGPHRSLTLPAISSMTSSETSATPTTNNQTADSVNSVIEEGKVPEPSSEPPVASPEETKTFILAKVGSHQPVVMHRSRTHDPSPRNYPNGKVHSDW